MTTDNPSTDQRTIKKAPSILVVGLSWAAVAVWAAFIFYMSSNTGSNLNEGMGFFSSIFQWLKNIQVQLLGPNVDALSSIAHFCEYALLGALLANALRCHVPLTRACVLAVLCASVYGVTDEIHQLFVPDRMCDPLDWLVDTLGATVGATLFRWRAAKREKPSF